MFKDAARQGLQTCWWRSGHPSRIIGLPSGVAVNVVYMLVRSDVEDGLAGWFPGCYTSGIKKTGERTACKCRRSSGHPARIIGLPSGVAVNVVYMLVRTDVKDGLAGRFSGCYASRIEKTGERAAGNRQCGAGHSGGIIEMPGSVAVQVVNVMVGADVEDGLAPWLTGCNAGRVDKAGKRKCRNSRFIMNR